MYQSDSEALIYSDFFFIFFKNFQAENSSIQCEQGKDFYDQTNQYNLEQCPYYHHSNTNFYQQPSISETEHNFEKNIAVHSMREYNDNDVSSTTKEIGFDSFDSNITTGNFSWNIPTTMPKVAILETEISTLTKSDKVSEKYVPATYFNIEFGIY